MFDFNIVSNVVFGCAIYNILFNIVKFGLETIGEDKDGDTETD